MIHSCVVVQVLVRPKDGVVPAETTQRTGISSAHVAEAKGLGEAIQEATL